MEVVQLLQYSSNGYVHPLGNNTGNNTAFAQTRKRSREDDEQQVMMIHQKPPQILTSPDCYHQVSRMLSSAGASTSANGAAIDIFSYVIERNSKDIDTIVHNQSERLMAELKAVRRRSSEAAMIAVEQTATKRLRETAAELNKARQINLLLEERIKQLNKEQQVWMEIAKKNEKFLYALSHHNISAAGRTEGAAADDAQSCCFDGINMGAKQVANNINEEEKKMCKACMEREVSVLLLPCRHLCLCSGCEPKLSRCPVCSASKSATLNVFLY